MKCHESPCRLVILSGADKPKSEDGWRWQRCQAFCLRCVQRDTRVLRHAFSDQCPMFFADYLQVSCLNRCVIFTLRTHRLPGFCFADIHDLNHSDISYKWSREALANELAALCERIDREFQATREDAGQQSEAAQFASRAGTIRTSSCLNLEVPVGFDGQSLETCGMALSFQPSFLRLFDRVWW